MICESSGCIQVDEYVDEVNGKTYIRLHSTETGTAMQCTRDEWLAFVADLIAGKWSHVGTLAVTR